MKVLLKYFQGYCLVTVLAPLLKLAEALLELTVPLIVAKIIDQAIPTGIVSELYPYLLTMFAVAFISLIMADSSQFMSAKAAVGFTENLTNDLYSQVIQLGEGAVNQISPESLIARLTADAAQVQAGLNTSLRLFLRSPFIVFGAFFMAMRLNFSLSMFFLMMIVLLFAVVFLILRWTSPLYQAIRQVFDKLVQLTRQQIQGIRVIKAFDKQASEIQEFSDHNQSVTRQQVKVAQIGALINPLTYVIVNVFLVIIIWQGGGRVNQGIMTQGETVAIINYLLLILVELVKMAMVVTTINKSMISANRISQIITRPVENLQATDTAKTGDLGDSIFKMKDLSFTYPQANELALDSIDLDIKAGQFIGIIGATGSGKSTLLKLLTQSYQPDQGEIIFNQAYFPNGSRKKLRQQMALVPAKIALFKGTIRSNLLVANPQASDEEMWQALAGAQAKDFVSQLDQALDAPVEAFGRNFSGGQRQRLAIARALLKQAPILIFDDSTSALDYVTEANFQAELKRNYQDMTILMISQRVHSLQAADQIVVLDEGKVVGLGHHYDLLENNETYQEIYASQTVMEVTDHEQ